MWEPLGLCAATGGHCALPTAWHKQEAIRANQQASQECIGSRHQDPQALGASCRGLHRTALGTADAPVGSACANTRSDRRTSRIFSHLGPAWGRLSPTLDICVINQPTMRGGRCSGGRQRGFGLKWAGAGVSTDYRVASSSSKHDSDERAPASRVNPPTPSRPSSDFPRGIALRCPLNSEFNRAGPTLAYSGAEALSWIADVPLINAVVSELRRGLAIAPNRGAWAATARRRSSCALEPHPTRSARPWSRRWKRAGRSLLMQGTRRARPRRGPQKEAGRNSGTGQQFLRGGTVHEE